MIFAQGKIDLQKAIEIAKSTFEVPNDFTNFSFNYDTYDHSENWSLSWTTPSQTYPNNSAGNINITVNASNGEITSMYYWRQISNNDLFAFPKISRDEARIVAEKLLNRLDPSKLKMLRHISNADQIIPLTLPHSYTFKWERMVNGIPFPNDGVQISVDAQTGQITNYQMTWTDESFPSPNDSISISQAKHDFYRADNLELQYYLSNPSRSSTAILVYDLVGKVSGSIDALSGKPIDLKDDQWYNVGNFSGEVVQAIKPSQMNQMNGNSSVNLEELKAIDESSEFMSEATAIEDLKRWVKIPEYLTLTNANLGKYWSDGEIIWNLYWQNGHGDNEMLSSISGGINAITGDLVYLYVNYARQSSTATKIDVTSAKKIAEKFLRDFRPQDYNNLKLSSSNTFKPEGAFNFEYERMVNGIPFANDTIDLQINDSGQITTFTTAWSKTKFESTSCIVPIQKIKRIFLNYRPLFLTYIKINGQNGSTSTVKLVYLPEIKSEGMTSDLLSAKTGQPLGWDGKPLSKSLKAYHFTDLGVTKYATAIQFLGQAGLFGEYGDRFLPQGKLTILTLIKNMLSIKNGSGYLQTLSDEQIIEMAKSQGLVTGDLNFQDPVDRITLSEILVNFLGLELASKSLSIYNSPFNDISSDETGYAVIANGLGLVKADGALFMPDRIVTREEAVISIIKAINLKMN